MTVEVYVFHPLGTNSGRVYLTLLEKGVDFTEKALVGTDFDHLKPEYLAINPRGQVPALVHDGLCLAEGMAINEYIDETFDGPPLRPADLTERWRMRWWCRHAENWLGRAIQMINWNRVVPNFVGERSPEELEKLFESVPDPDRRRAWRNAYNQTITPEQIAESRRRLGEGSKRVEALLAQQPWVAGQAYSLADIDLYNFYGFLDRFMPEFMNTQDTPRTMDWAQRMSERPAVQEMRRRSPVRMRQPEPAKAQG